MFIVKHLRDLRSGKPETDVLAFPTEEAARQYASSQADGQFDDDEGEDGDEGYIWYKGDRDMPDEYFEVEPLEQGPASSPSITSVVKPS